MKSSQNQIQLRSILNRPFPKNENQYSHIKVMALVSLFVSLFLYVIRPFGLNQVEEEIFRIACLFGLITFISGILYQLILTKFVKIKTKEKDFTLGKWILQTVGLLLFISIFNCLYVHVKFSMSSSDYLNLVWATFIIGIFPTVFIGTTSMLMSERNNARIADQINNQGIRANTTQTNHETIFDIPTQAIIYIESLQNYVNIYFVDNNKIAKRTERATLKSCESQIENPDLMKCHRSYIVNKSKIESVSGNAQGLKLKIIDIDFQVPVSRSYIPQFRP